MEIEIRYTGNKKSVSQLVREAADIIAKIDQKEGVEHLKTIPPFVIHKVKGVTKLKFKK